MDVYLTGDFEALSFEQSVLLGANYSKYTTNDAYARMFTPGVDIDNIDHHRPYLDFDSIADRANLATSTYNIRQKGLYGSWRVKLLDPLTLIVGARSSWYDFAFAQQNYFARELQEYGENNSTKTTGKVTPFYGLVYALNDQWSTYATYSEVFIPQTARAMGNLPLKPVEGDNYELGLKGELMDGPVECVAGDVPLHPTRTAPWPTRPISARKVAGGLVASRQPARCAAKASRPNSVVKCCQACRWRAATPTTPRSFSRTRSFRARCSPPPRRCTCSACGPTINCRATSARSAWGLA